MVIKKLWHKLTLIQIYLYYLPRRKRHPLPSSGKNYKTPKYQLSRKIYTIKLGREILKDLGDIE
jgi:hypothetical protein